MGFRDFIVSAFAEDDLSDTLFGYNRIPTAELLGLAPGPNQPRASSSKSTDSIPLYDESGSAGSFQFVNPFSEIKGLSRNAKNLISYHRRVEIVFACINQLAMAAVEPGLTIEKRRRQRIDVPEAASTLIQNMTFEPVKRFIWEEVEDHPISKLMMRPNPMMSGKQFSQAWIVSKHVFGIFYAEKVRDTVTDEVVQMWPIDPRRVKIGRSKGNQVIDYRVEQIDEKGRVTGKVTIAARDMFVDAFFDPANFYYGGLSPLAVALGSADMDAQQTMYIRKYFKNAGVPSGLLKLKNQTLGPKKADKIKKRFMDHFSQESGGQHSVLVLDAEAEYQTLGAKLRDLEADSVQGRAECKLCMVFGVPPSLIFSFTGISNNSYTSQQQALPDFWSVKLKPMFEQMADTLTWQLGIDFEDEDLFLSKKVRIKWDMSEVKALQEDRDKVEERARLAYAGDVITKNEVRAVCGYPADPLGDYYSSNVRTTRMYPTTAAQDAATFGSVPATQLIATNKQGDLNAASNDLSNAANEASQSDTSGQNQNPAGEGDAASAAVN